MALNNQLPLSAAERNKGSLSDILPELGELVPGVELFPGAFRDARRQGKTTAQMLAEQAALNQLRQFAQQGQMNQQSQQPSTTRDAGQAQGNGQQSNMPGSVWGPIPALNLHGSMQANSNNPVSMPEGTPSLPGLPAELLPYAQMLQAQAQAQFMSPGSGHLTRELWQRIMEAAPQMQLPQSASHAMPSNAVLAPQAVYPSGARPAEPPLSSPAQPSQGDQLGRQGVKRAAEAELQEPTARSEDSHDSAEGGRSGNERNGSGDRKESFSGAAYSTRPARTPRQQEQNKMAQQRYRERRKMKVAEMETAMHQMQRQLDELQAVLKQNIALQDKNLALEKSLAEKDHENTELTAQARSGAEETVEAAASPQALRELKSEFQQQIMQLEQFLEQHKLTTGDSSGLDRSLLDELGQLVTACSLVCQQAQAEGIALDDVLTHSDAAAHFAAAKGKDTWAHVIEAVNVQDVQRRQLIMWHEGHLKNLQCIFACRQPLIQQILQQLPPKLEGADPAKGPTAENWVRMLSSQGYHTTAKYNLAQLRLLDQLRDCVRKEAKAVQQFNFVILSRILNPVQAALLLIHAWPAYADCMSFINQLAAQPPVEAQEGSTGAKPEMICASKNSATGAALLKPDVAISAPKGSG